MVLVAVGPEPVTEPATEPGESAELPASLPTERLEHELASLAVQLAAATCRWLLLVGEYDRREAWVGWGCRSCAHWLSWHCGLDLSTAREHVRVSRALEELPQVVREFSAGRLSYSKVRALTRLATAENEGELIQLARDATGAQLQAILHAYRQVEEADLDRVEAQHARRDVNWSWDDDGSLVLRARLSTDEGAAVVAAIEGLAERRRAEHRQDAYASADAYADAPVEVEPAVFRADALVELVTASVGGVGVEMVVHVGDGRCALDDGPALHPETARRLGCDAALRLVAHHRDGTVLDVGRRTRAIPPAIRRALRERDGGCRFPGCAARRNVDGHHVRHWARGGETAVHNLVSLCRHHHRLVHEGGFGVRPHGSGFRFSRPDGGDLALLHASADASRRPVPALTRDPADPHALRAPNEPYALDLTIDGLLAVKHRHRYPQPPTV